MALFDLNTVLADQLKVANYNTVISSFNDAMIAADNNAGSGVPGSRAIPVVADEVARLDFGPTPTEYQLTGTIAAMQIFLSSRALDYAFYFPHDLAARMDMYADSGIPSGFRYAYEWDPAVNDWTNYNDAMFQYKVTFLDLAVIEDEIDGPWILTDIRAVMANPNSFALT